MIFLEATIMLMLKRGFFGLCIGLFMVVFHQYFWSAFRPIFIDGRIDPKQKVILLVALILVGFVVALIGIYYERREIIRMANVNRKKIAVQIGFLIVLILIGSLAFSVALEF
jgi:hypothetical protein